LKKLALFILTLALAISTMAGAQTVINCGAGTPNPWVSGGAGACHFAPGGWIDSRESWNFRTGGTLSGTAITLVPIGAGHAGWGLVPQFGGVGSSTPISILAFTEEMQFTWNGNNITMVWQNNDASATGTCPGAGCLNFSQGAGSEAGCVQTADGPTNVPNNSLCLDLDGYDPMTESRSFAGTTIGLYQPFQASYLPNATGLDYIPMYPINKLSTSPVCLNNPCTTPGAGNSDVFDLKVIYDHGTGILQVFLYDVTAGGTCSPTTGGTCFTHSFPGVWIPEIVGSTVAYPTITAGSSGGAQAPTVTENVNSLVFTVNTPSAPSYSFTAWNANSTFNVGTTSIATPIYSLAPGSYTGTQSLSMSGVTTANSYICYEVAPAGTVLTQYPQTDNNGGCQPLSSGATGGLYTGAIPLSVGSWDVYAMSSANNTAFNCPNGCISPTGLGPPSTLVKATYTISSGSTVATPTFLPVAGPYTSPQSVAISTVTTGATIHYTTDGSTPTTSSTVYTAPITFSVSETVKAIGVLSGDTNSSVGTAAYTINAAPGGSVMRGVMKGVMQ
jgi:hypothetical protein